MTRRRDEISPWASFRRLIVALIVAWSYVAGVLFFAWAFALPNEPWWTRLLFFGAYVMAGGLTTVFTGPEPER